MTPPRQTNRDDDSYPAPRPLAVQLSLTRAMVATCVFQVIALLLSWFARDGGSMFRTCLSTAAIYWVSAAWIVIQRRGKLTHGELMYLTVGFPLLTVGAYLLAPVMQKLGVR